MPNETSLYPAALNGRPASAADLIPLAFAGFQVRDCKIRGLDLHLKRLSNASLSFFGRALPDEELRAHIKQAIDAGPAEGTVERALISGRVRDRPLGVSLRRPVPETRVTRRLHAACSPERDQISSARSRPEPRRSRDSGYRAIVNKWRRSDGQSAKAPSR